MNYFRKLTMSAALKENSVAALICLMVFSPAVLANSLTKMDFSAMPGNKLQVVLELNEPLSSLPASFSTDSPARIAVDLEGVSIGLKEKTKNIGLGSARSVTAVEAGGKTRVVLNLTNPVGYEIDNIDNKVVIQVDGGAVAAAASASSGGFVAATGTNELLGIDFKRGEKGKAEVIFDLSNDDAIVDMHYEAGKLVLDMMNTSLKPELSRMLDVSDFATPVRSIETKANGNNVRVTVDAEGDYDHLAYQTEGSYVLEVRPLTKQEIERAKLENKVYEGDRLSLNFQNIEVRSVLQLLADFTGLNMVVSDSVGGNVTLRLKNVPWDQAMDIILQTKDLAMRQNDNVIMIAPSKEINAWEKAQLEQLKIVEELSPLRTELIEINYADAADIASILESGRGSNEDDKNSLLSARGQVTVDPRTNSLLVLETSQKLEEISNLIRKLDVPVKQVMIESRIVTADDNFTRELGIRWNAGQDGTDDTEGSNSTNLDVSGFVNAAAFAPVGGLDVVLTKIGSTVLDLELRAMQAESKGEILSNPRIVTANNSSATIEQGIKIAVPGESESGGTTTEYADATLKLTVTPQITPDDRIIMELQVNKDSVVAGSTDINTRNLQTNVVVDNGQTVILGGVYEQTKTKSVDKVPFFGDLPILGYAFRQTQNVENNSELLIFVTPQIIKESVAKN